MILQSYRRLGNLITSNGLTFAKLERLAFHIIQLKIKRALIVSFKVLIVLTRHAMKQFATRQRPPSSSKPSWRSTLVIKGPTG